MKSDIIDNRNKSTMIRQLITEFPLSDVPKERTVTEEKIRKYTYTKEEVDVLIANAVKEAVEEAVETEEAEVGSSEDVKASIDPDILQNIPVTISVEVGRTSLKIKDLMRLTQGSVVELERLAGEPLDLFVNSTLVAQGEVVLVNDRYGVRLTSVVPAAERIRNI